MFFTFLCCLNSECSFSFEVLCEKLLFFIYTILHLSSSNISKKKKSSNNIVFYSQKLECNKMVRKLEAHIQRNIREVYCIQFICLFVRMHGTKVKLVRKPETGTVSRHTPFCPALEEHSVCLLCLDSHSCCYEELGWKDLDQHILRRNHYVHLRDLAKKEKN